MVEIHIDTSDLLMRSLGIDVSRYDESFLDKSLRERLRETHCCSVEEYCSLLGQKTEEEMIFFESLHVGYSEFFRNPLTFAVLERLILPSLVMKMKSTNRKEIRMWSAACAAGQETYSLAILLEELKSNDTDKLDYRIFATDQDESRINEAIRGHYAAAALRNVSLKRAGEWFDAQGDTYTIKPGLKENIDFSVFNLLSEQLSCPPASIFGDFDLLVCANLLFYYKPEFRKLILEKIDGCLASGGYMVTGEAEREILLNYNYSEVFPLSAVFRK